MKTVLEVMQEYKQKGVNTCWIQKENGYEYLYGLYGYSSIENEKYIEDNKEIFNSNVINIQEIDSHTIRIIYK